MSNKIREEDDRWIVNDLGEKGKNVNNWHYSEKDITQWSAEYLKEQLKDKELFKNEKTRIFIKELRGINGTVFIFNRKK